MFADFFHGLNMIFMPLDEVEEYITNTTDQQNLKRVKLCVQDSSLRSNLSRPIPTEA